VLISIVAVFVVAALAVAGGIVVHNRSIPRGPLPAVGPQIAAPVPALAVNSASAPLPTADGLAAALAGPLKQPNLGSHVSVEVADLATGTMLYGHGDTSPTTPASTLKLATTIAVLSTRGPNYRITTNVVAGPLPGEVVIVGAGDPTLAAQAVGSYPEAGRLQDLATQVKQALGGVKPTKLIVDTSLYSGSPVGPGWSDENIHSTYLTSIYALSTDAGKINPANVGYAPRYDDSATGAAAVFAHYLGLPPSAVVSGKAPATPTDPSSPTAPGAVLASVQSAPLIRIIETMLATSDNMLAEAMARQVAIATGHPASFAGAAAAVTDELNQLGLPTQGVHIVDGSGISHANKVTPALMAAILTYAARPDHPELHAMFTGLPVAGYSGTLLERFHHAGMSDTFGMIRAKTGTLDGVTALAGYVVDLAGRPLILVVLLDDAPSPGAPAAIDAIGTAVRNCGCGSPN
jgi:D-alanyl-D-alanine carboxypeptidase/D-alanyl-D-alanine-endopeptidase (penicillin-binding protein 4)